VVVGVESKKAEEILKKLYEPFLRNGNPIHVMDIRSAELTKYACNSFLATKISFMNDIAELCERMGADVNAVRTGMSTDNRIGKAFLYPGVGYGGSCFPKDVKALINTANKYDVELDIVKSAEHVNKLQRERFVKKVMNHFKGNVKGVTLAVWGLSFKPQTDDMREAPSITIIQELCKHGAKVRASDPVALSNAKEVIKAEVEYFEDPFEALSGATALLILTEWNEYRTCDIATLKKSFTGKVVFDGRNIWSGAEIRKAGFEYYGIGRN
jgi:UDPglucose 6-dehydrogenase